jgi:hypothetical protein
MGNSEVMQAVLKGKRLPKPANCPNELYELMLKCWKMNLDNQPSFQELLTNLIAFSKNIKHEKDTPSVIQADPEEEESL